jgi:putative Holliday junction resolvase
VREGVRLGIDAGAVRIGVARSDRDGLLATPVETVKADQHAVAHLIGLALDLEAFEIVVGLPLSLSGEEGAAAASARELAVRIANAEPALAVRMVDERLSTVSATAALRTSGVPGRKQRAVIDQAAAVVILQSALDHERVSGRPPGEPVEVGP